MIQQISSRKIEQLAHKSQALQRVTFHGSVQMYEIGQMSEVRMIGVHFRRLFSRLYIYAFNAGHRIKQTQ